METHAVVSHGGIWSRQAAFRALLGGAMPVLLGVLGLWVILVRPGPASAIPIESADGALMGSLDTTVTTGAAVRASDRNYNLIGQQNGGRAWSINADDGDLNWGRWDFTSLSARITHEVELNWENVGFFGRGYYFYDAAVMDLGTDRKYKDRSGRNTPDHPRVAQRPHLTRSARRRAGWDAELLDYYLNVDFRFLDKPTTVRIGSQVISWGESTFIQNGINVINPVDVTQLRVAGAELRDALIPVPAIDLKYAFNEQVSIEGFYQLYWDHTEIEPMGTFFSTTDIASPGAEAAMLKFGRPGRTNPVDNPPGAAFPDPNLPPGTQFPFGTHISRAKDRNPDRQGEGGIALRYFAPELSDTELGLYWIHYHSRLPLLSGRTGRPDYPPGAYARTGAYFREFPHDIDLIGVSFNTEPYTGFALQGEVSYKFGQPLQVDDVELLFSALSPANPEMFPADQLQLGQYDFNQYVKGYRRKDVLQYQATLTRLFGPVLGSDQLVLLGEVGATWIRNMEHKYELRYEAPGTFTSANIYYNPVSKGGSPTYPAGVQPDHENGYAFADRFSWGYQLVAKADYLGAIGPINIFPIAAFQHDVEGTTPSPIINFIDDRKVVTVRLDATYLESWRASLAYTNFFDGKGPHYNLLNDRDFISLSASYSF